MIADILHIVLKKALHFVLEMIVFLSSFKTNTFMQLFDLYQQNTGHQWVLTDSIFVHNQCATILSEQISTPSKRSLPLLNGKSKVRQTGLWCLRWDERIRVKIDTAKKRNKWRKKKKTCEGQWKYRD